MELLLNRNFWDGSAEDFTYWEEDGEGWTAETGTLYSASVDPSETAFGFDAYLEPPSHRDTAAWQDIDLVARGLSTVDIDAGTQTVWASFYYKIGYNESPSTDYLQFVLEAFDGDPDAGGTLLSTLVTSATLTSANPNDINPYSSGPLTIPTSARYLRYKLLKKSAGFSGLGMAIFATSLETVNTSRISTTRLQTVATKIPTQRISTARLQRVYSSTPAAPSYPIFVTDNPEFETGLDGWTGTNFTWYDNNGDGIATGSNQGDPTELVQDTDLVAKGVPAADIDAGVLFADFFCWFNLWSTTYGTHGKIYVEAWDGDPATGTKLATIIETSELRGGEERWYHRFYDRGAIPATTRFLRTRLTGVAGSSDTYVDYDYFGLGIGTLASFTDDGSPIELVENPTFEYQNDTPLYTWGLHTREVEKKPTLRYSGVSSGYVGDYCLFHDGFIIENVDPASSRYADGLYAEKTYDLVAHGVDAAAIDAGQREAELSFRVITRTHNDNEVSYDDEVRITLIAYDDHPAHGGTALGTIYDNEGLPYAAYEWTQIVSTADLPANTRYLKFRIFAEGGDDRCLRFAFDDYHIKIQTATGKSPALHPFWGRNLLANGSWQTGTTSGWTLSNFLVTDNDAELADAGNGVYRGAPDVYFIKGVGTGTATATQDINLLTSGVSLTDVDNDDQAVVLFFRFARTITNADLAQVYIRCWDDGPATEITADFTQVYIECWDADPATGSKLATVCADRGIYKKTQTFYVRGDKGYWTPKIYFGSIPIGTRYLRVHIEVEPESGGLAGFAFDTAFVGVYPASVRAMLEPVEGIVGNHLNDGYATWSGYGFEGRYVQSPTNDDLWVESDVDLVLQNPDRLFYQIVDLRALGLAQAQIANGSVRWDLNAEYTGTSSNDSEIVRSVEFFDAHPFHGGVVVGSSFTRTYLEGSEASRTRIVNRDKDPFVDITGGYVPPTAKFAVVRFYGEPYQGDVSYTVVNTYIRINRASLMFTPFVALLTNGSFDNDLSGWTATNFIHETGTGADGSSGYADGDALGTDGELSQDVDLVAAGIDTTRVDAGELHLNLEFYYQATSNVDKEDTGQVIVEAYDGDPAVSGTLIGASVHTPEFRQFANGQWLPFVESAPVPANARFLRVRLLAKFYSGSVVNAAFDSVYFDIGFNEAGTDDGTPIELVKNGAFDPALPLPLYTKGLCTVDFAPDQSVFGITSGYEGTHCLHGREWRFGEPITAERTFSLEVAGVDLTAIDAGNREATLSFYCINPSPSVDNLSYDDDVHIALEAYDGHPRNGGTLLDTLYYNGGLPFPFENWTRVSSTKDLPANTRYLRWSLQCIEGADILPRFALDLLSITVQTATGQTPSAHPVWGPNLLTNGSFETGDATGWTLTNCDVTTTDSGLIDTNSGARPNARDPYFITTTTDGELVAIQDVDLGAAGVDTVAIDENTKQLVFFFYNAQTQTYEDYGQIQVSCYDGDPAAGGNLIATVCSDSEITKSSAAFRYWSDHVFTPRIYFGGVRPNTRYIRVTAKTKAINGTKANQAWDSFFLGVFDKRTREYNINFEALTTRRFDDGYCGWGGFGFEYNVDSVDHDFKLEGSSTSGVYSGVDRAFQTVDLESVGLTTADLDGGACLWEFSYFADGTHSAPDGLQVNVKFYATHPMEGGVEITPGYSTYHSLGQGDGTTFTGSGQIPSGARFAFVEFETAPENGSIRNIVINDASLKLTPVVAPRKRRRPLFVVMSFS